MKSVVRIACLASALTLLCSSAAADELLVGGDVGIIAATSQWDGAPWTDRIFNGGDQGIALRGRADYKLLDDQLALVTYVSYARLAEKIAVVHERDKATTTDLVNVQAGVAFWPSYTPWLRGLFLQGTAGLGGAFFTAVDPETAELHDIKRSAFVTTLLAGYKWETLRLSVAATGLDPWGGFPVTITVSMGADLSVFSSD